MAYGFQPAKATAPPAAVRTGYVELLAARLRKLRPGIEVVNYGCPGESLVTFTKGGCEWLSEGRRLHDPFSGSQLGAALAFLRAHPGQVSPITITLWGNDIAGFEDGCHNNLRCIRKRAPHAVSSLASRLRSILAQLRSAAPTAEIIATGAWNFEVDRLARVAFLYRSLDKRIRRAAGRAGAHVANTRAIFNPRGSIAATRKRICALTFVCSQNDPHPRDAGYRAMAKAFFAASGYAPKP